VTFACGAAYDLKGAVSRDRNGNPNRMLVFANCKEGPTAPKGPDGVKAACLFGCPARVKDSRRKVVRAWVGDAAVKPEGEPVLCVTCKPVS
jgi:hypothetical protein